jgi:16S rRNA (cytosine967-C5)-methyltransferase
MLDQCEREGMDRRQRAFVKRLTEGIIERRIEIDNVIRTYTKKGARIRPVIRDILRMGIFQILYMDAVPDSAACNEAVKLTKLSGKKELSGFVNGVLRTVAREKDKGIFAAAAREDGASSDPAALSRKYSMPEWIIRLWNEQRSEQDTRALLEALLEVRPVSIRFDDRCSAADIEKILAGMQEKGVTATKGHYHALCYELTGTDSVATLPGYREGLWTVQDESSMLVAEAAGLQGGETVYDVCAAPGGKSMHCASKLLALAKRAEEGAAAVKAGTVHAFDLSKGKTAQIMKNVRRMHLPNVVVSQRDALLPVPAEAGAADVLLCDLPCSGLGVIGRKRDIKYHVSPAQLEELAKLQKDILRSAVGYLKEGGVLIYSTCTINRGENEEIAAFIEKELGFTADPLAPHLPAGIPGIDGHMLQLLPHIHGTDGFFLARFIKKPA